MATMTKRHFLGLGAGALVLAAGAGFAMRPSAAPGYEHTAMSVEEMKASGALIVDIRTPPEWTQTGVIEDAVLLTFEDPNRFLAQIAPALDDGRDLVLVCRSGNRTQAAARALVGKIDNRIISAEGGMKRLIAQGYRPVRAS